MSDYNFLMESRLSPAQFQVLTQLSQVAADQGLNLYLVGGAVRDLTYGQQLVRDLDFAVEGKTEKILKHFTPLPTAKSRSNRRHTIAAEASSLEIEYLHYDAPCNAAEFAFSNGVRVEMGMSHREIYRKPGRPPELVPAAIFDDLQCRDFSINAMAVSLHPNSRGLLLDPTNGAADIENHELRVLHSRSFLDDPSRIYRLLRLGLRLGFKPDQRTVQYLERAMESRLYERLNPKQQGRELRAVLQEDDPGRVLKLFSTRGILSSLDKDLARSRIPFDRLSKVRSVASLVPDADPLLLYFHCLGEKLSSSQKKRLAKKILRDRKVIRLALSLDHTGRNLARALASSGAALPSQVFKLLTGQPRALLLYLLAYYPKSKVQNRVKNFLVKSPQIQSKLPRAELEALGVKSGPQFEEILDKIFMDQLDGKIRTRQQMTKALRLLAQVEESAVIKPAKAVAPQRKGRKRRKA